MIRYALFILTIFLFTACSEETQKEKREVKKTESKLPLIVEEENGRFTEWYPGRKQIKIEGRKDERGRRVGIWKLYTPQGVEQSVTIYNQGKKDGHIVVRHPNGTVYYSGEYEMDEPVGVWKFYNDQGQLVERKFYDEE